MILFQGHVVDEKEAYSIAVKYAKENTDMVIEFGFKQGSLGKYLILTTKP